MAYKAKDVKRPKVRANRESCEAYLAKVQAEYAVVKARARKVRLARPK